MKIRFYSVFIFLILMSCSTFSQAVQPEKRITGFVRAGSYGSTNGHDNKIIIPSAFTDLDVRLDIEDGKIYRAYADVRLRYGTEFSRVKNYFDIKEPYAGIYGNAWSLTLGQQIIKWGKADFTNPVSKLSSRDHISRSPDPADMDIGNLLIRARWYPFSRLNLEFVATPFYRPSTLVIEPLQLPGWIKIDHPEMLVTGKGLYSLGLRSEMHFGFADVGISWFKGSDPMPGTKLAGFTLDMSSGLPVPSIELTMTPYKINNAGIDFEATPGAIGLRGEFALTLPEKSYKEFEYSACKQIQWVIGADRDFGNWRLVAEYSGKFLPGFEPSAFNPIIGTDPDMTAFSALMSASGADLKQYVRQQVSAFNRLYNYQLEEQYHSGALKIERDILFGMLVPSVIVMHNFTTGDLMLRSELIYKPADGIAINVGGEFFYGRKGSVYDIVDEYLNGIFIAIKAEF